MVVLSHIIIANAERCIHEWSKGGRTLVSGYNGPYNDVETSYRTIAHSSIIVFKAYQLTGDLRYKQFGQDFLDRLFDGDARPYGFTIHARQSSTKDQCNGLIGQAWIIEALCYGYMVTHDTKYLVFALDLFLLHPFVFQRGYWKKREINGVVKSYDFTFNHQLWFAMSGSLLFSSVISISVDLNESEKIKLDLVRKKVDIVKNQVDLFMDTLEHTTHIHHNGLIRHLIFAPLVTPVYLFKNVIMSSKIDTSYLYTKEIGYHAFNMYAFAVLYTVYPNHSFWSSSKFKKMLEFSLSSEHLNVARVSKYGCSYNPSGIEMAYVVSVFRDHPFIKSRFSLSEIDELILTHINLQFETHLDTKTLYMDKNTSDFVVLQSRIYELVRLM